eukprot:54648-Chlamydomonas_euryale.AAC.1
MHGCAGKLHCLPWQPTLRAAVKRFTMGTCVSGGSTVDWGCVVGPWWVCMIPWRVHSGLGMHGGSMVGFCDSVESPQWIGDAWWVHGGFV